MGKCGVVIDVETLGCSLGKFAEEGKKMTAAAKRKRDAQAAAAGDGLAQLCGRNKGDRAATARMYEDGSNRLRLQIFAAVQIAGAAGGDSVGSVGDEAGAGGSGLGGARRDSRVGPARE